MGFELIRCRSALSVISCACEATRSDATRREVMQTAPTATPRNLDRFRRRLIHFFPPTRSRPTTLCTPSQTPIDYIDFSNHHYIQIETPHSPPLPGEMSQLASSKPSPLLFTLDVFLGSQSDFRLFLFSAPIISLYHAPHTHFPPYTSRFVPNEHYLFLGNGEDAMKWARAGQVLGQVFGPCLWDGNAVAVARRTNPTSPGQGSFLDQRVCRPGALYAQAQMSSVLALWRSGASRRQAPGRPSPPELGTLSLSWRLASQGSAALSTLR